MIRAKVYIKYFSAAGISCCEYNSNKEPRNPRMQHKNYCTRYGTTVSIETECTEKYPSLLNIQPSIHPGIPESHAAAPEIRIDK